MSLTTNSWAPARAGFACACAGADGSSAAPSTAAPVFSRLRRSPVIVMASSWRIFAIMRREPRGTQTGCGRTRERPGTSVPPGRARRDDGVPSAGAKRDRTRNRARPLAGYAAAVVAALDDPLAAGRAPGDHADVVRPHHHHADAGAGGMAPMRPVAREVVRGAR